MAVEVVPFHLLGVGENETADTQRGELSPKTLQHLWSRQREEQINGRTRRNFCSEFATQNNRFLTDRFDDSASQRAVEQADAKRFSRCRTQCAANMLGTLAGESYTAFEVRFLLLDEN